MNSTRKTALIAGALFLITFLTSIPAALLLYHPVLDHTGYIVGAGADTACPGRVARAHPHHRQHRHRRRAVPRSSNGRTKGLALGYVTARIIESTFIAIGIVSLLAIVTLRRDVGGAGGAGSLVPVGRSLVAIHDWTFLIGPGWIVGVGNGLILGYLMYRSGLVPRRMAILGLIGGPLIIVSGTAVLFNVIEPGSAAQFIATIPEFVWELSLGIYLMVKGFRPSPIIAEAPPTVHLDAVVPAA